MEHDPLGLRLWSDSWSQRIPERRLIVFEGLRVRRVQACPARKLISFAVVVDVREPTTECAERRTIISAAPNARRHTEEFRWLGRPETTDGEALLQDLLALHRATPS